MNLELREKIFLAVGAVFLVVVGFYFLIIGPQRGRLQELRDLIPRKDDQVVELRGVIDDYQRLKRVLDEQKRKIGERGSSTFLQSYIDTEAKKLGIAIASMVPKTVDLGTDYQEYQVEVRLERTTLDMLVSFLYRLENSEKLLVVKNVRVKRRYDDHNQADVTMIISTLTQK